MAIVRSPTCCHAIDLRQTLAKFEHCWNRSLHGRRGYLDEPHPSSQYGPERQTMTLAMTCNLHHFVRILFERDHGLRNLAGAGDLPAKHQPYYLRQFSYQITSTQKVAYLQPFEERFDTWYTRAGDTQTYLKLGAYNSDPNMESRAVMRTDRCKVCKATYSSDNDSLNKLASSVIDGNIYLQNTWSKTAYHNCFSRDCDV